MGLVQTRDVSSADYPAFEGVYNHVRQALALTPGAAMVDALLALCRWESDHPFQGLQTRIGFETLATWLAAGQPASTLLKLFHSQAQEKRFTELLARLGQEMALRDKVPTGEPVVSAFFDRLKQRGHPLSKLPLQRLPIESEITLPRYTPLGGSAVELPFGPLMDRVPRATTKHGLGSEVIADETTSKSDRDEISAVVSLWATESNGRWEVHRYRLRRSYVLQPELVADLLGHLDLECVAGTLSRDIAITEVSAAQAFKVLFSAGSGGGAYPSGHLGAYGRVAAWRSLRGLLGSDPDATLEDVQTEAESAAWFQFSAPSAWFEQVAWDLGLAVFRLDTNELGILAATDTD
jgi:hypothetical protein